MNKNILSIVRLILCNSDHSLFNNYVHTFLFSYQFYNLIIKLYSIIIRQKMEKEDDICNDSMSLIMDSKFFQGNSQQINNNQKSNYYFQNSYINSQLNRISDVLVLEDINLNYTQSVQPLVQLNQIQHLSTSLVSSESRLIVKSQKNKKIRKKDKQKSLMDKKKQNSKNYRHRKKQYFSKLEQENQFYKSKTIELQQKIQQLQSTICELKYAQTNYEKVGYEQQYMKDVSMYKQKISNSTISKPDYWKLTIYMRDKYGPAGSDRTRILNYYMSEYINNSLADYHKYFMTCSLKKRGVFGQKSTKLDKKVQQLLQLNSQQQSKIQQNIFEDLHKASTTYMNYCKNIYSNYVGLLDQANKFQDKLFQCLSFLDMNQMTRFIFWFVENKHRTEMRKLRQDWFQYFAGQQNTTN